jgi:hypothetical protein
MAFSMNETKENAKQERRLGSQLGADLGGPVSQVKGFGPYP